MLATKTLNAKTLKQPNCTSGLGLGNVAIKFAKISFELYPDLQMGTLAAHVSESHDLCAGGLKP